MRNSTGTMQAVSPRSRDEPPEHLLNRVRELAAAAAELKPAVLAALHAGGSIRVVAEAAQLSPTTVKKWKDEHYSANRPTRP